MHRLVESLSSSPFLFMRLFFQGEIETPPFFPFMDFRICLPCDDFGDGFDSLFSPERSFSSHGLGIVLLVFGRDVRQVPLSNYYFFSSFLSSTEDTFFFFRTTYISGYLLLSLRCFHIPFAWRVFWQIVSSLFFIDRSFYED